MNAVFAFESSGFDGQDGNRRKDSRDLMEMDGTLPADQPANILIVDDTVANLRLLTDMLQKSGHRVRPVTSGRRALSTIHSEVPDIILLDIKMPDMDGFEFCRILKADPLYSDIPVIFISALTDIDEKVKAFQVGGVDYITKPFQIEEVEMRVKTHLSLKRAREDMRRIQGRLIQSEKMTALSGLMVNIAHHWRQPLNLIGLLIQDLEEAMEQGELDENYLRSSVRDAMRLLCDMSNVIDTLSGLFAEDKSITRFNIISKIREVVSTLIPVYRHAAATITIDSAEELEIEGYPLEYGQTIAQLLLGNLEYIKNVALEKRKLRIGIDADSEGRSRVTILNYGIPFTEELEHDLMTPHTGLGPGTRGGALNVFITRMIVEKKFNGQMVVGNRDGLLEFTILV